MTLIELLLTPLLMVFGFDNLEALLANQYGVLLPLALIFFVKAAPRKEKQTANAQ